MSTPRPKKSLPAAEWARWPREKLLDLRFSDLELSVEGTWLEACVHRLYTELERKGIALRPHVWLADEWFSPSGVPGVAIPFYLAHPRLTRLERRMMLEAEGSSRRECMRLLRHESGHAIQHAYQVQRKRRWQKLFGRSSKPYPELYQPNPASKRFVQHLDGWYAQSHPDEDFAETFAVWLRPRSSWRRRYQGWPALEKLKFVDELIDELRGVRPRVRSRSRPYATSRDRRTLREHYEAKQARFGGAYSEAYDRDLKRLFSAGADASHPTAASFVTKRRRVVSERVCRWTGEHLFTVDQLLKEMVVRCRELRLRADGPPDALEVDLSVFLAVQTAQCLYRGAGWHPL